MPRAAAKGVAKPTARTAQTVAVGVVTVVVKVVVTGVVRAAVDVAVAAGVARGVRNASASITRANPRVQKAPTAASSTHLLPYLQRRRRVQSGHHAAPNAGNAAAGNGAPSAIAGLRKPAKPKGLVGPKPNAPITRLPTPQAPWQWRAPSWRAMGQSIRQSRASAGHVGVTAAPVPTVPTVPTEVNGVSGLGRLRAQTGLTCKSSLSQQLRMSDSWTRHRSSRASLTLQTP